MANITTRVWFSDGTTYPWPEQQAGVSPNVGVCFPGGGTRALSAAMGQLRAMINQNIIQSVDYISCVSGGSWAAAAFAYYNTGATSDQDFLGPITDPGDISEAGLNVLSSDCVGYGATQSLDKALWTAYHTDKVDGDLLWITAVGAVFFDRYGLNDSSYYSFDAATVQAIQTANPSLANATFHTVRQPSGYTMPYLLINATIDGPTNPGDYVTDPLVMVTYTPLYNGIPLQQVVTYSQKSSGPITPSTPATVGGGFIEPFAWGSSAPATTGASGGTVSAGEAPAVFRLIDASGTSSSAFAETAAKNMLLDVDLPEQPYWPPMSSGAQIPAQSFDFGDGGNLENYGLIPLLMRGVKKVILFVNTDSPLSLSYVPSTNGASSADLDPNLPVLFGVPVTSGGNAAADNNQVFPSSDFVTLISKLQALKTNGQAMIVPMTHEVLANQWWGVTSGSVEILWVYLDQVTAWSSQITDTWVTQQLQDGSSGAFPNFPNYKTVDEDGTATLTQLTAPQVNLLADLTCWVVTENVSAFTNFVSGG
ncbi:MAG: patatin-like phospholipase family protein [Acidobacteriota bacterium]|nr:patatin-like phospholipase family protein [Acidobacteriota bacterium]